MSTIKSSAENLTLNADGANNDVIIQSNGSTKVTVDGATGNVGVGTTSNFGKLSVNVSSGAPATSGNMTNGLTVHNTDGGRAVQLGVNDSGGYNFINSGYVNSAGNSQPLAIFTGGSERMRVTTDGLTFNGDTAAANALDDYEEGGFTPTISGSTSGSGTVAGNGYYTKVGRLCTISMNFGSVAFPTISGTLQIALPFAAGGAGEYHGSDIYFYPLAAWTVGSNFSGLVPVVAGSNSFHSFMIKGVNVDRQTPLTSSNSSISGNSSTYARYSLTYVTAT